MMISKQLALFVQLQQTEADAVREKGLVGMNNGQAIALYPVNGPEKMNALLPQLDAEWVLLISEHEQVSSDVLTQLNSVLEQSPGTQVFFFQDDFDATLALSNLDDFMAQLCCLTPFGLLVHREFIVAQGGFPTQRPKAFDIDLFVHCIGLENPPIAAIPKSSFSALLNPMPAASLGLDRVVQATDAMAHLQGKSTAYWFAAYAKRVTERMASLSENHIERAKLQLHLATLAYRIAHQVLQADQHVFAPHVRRSVFDDGSTRDMALAVDQAVMACLQQPAQAMVLDESVHCFALGEGVYTAQLLKQLGLKRVTGPLDWVNTQAMAVSHMLGDAFNTFLNPQHCVAAPTGQGGAVAMLRARQHDYYLREYGVQHMYNFHDMNRAGDLAQYTMAAQVMLQALQAPYPTLNVLLSPNPANADAVAALAKALSDAGPNNRLLVVHVQYQTPAVLGTEYESLKTTGSGVRLAFGPSEHVLLATLPVFSQVQNGAYAEALDNVRLGRLVHGVALGWLGRRA